MGINATYKSRSAVEIANNSISTTTLAVAGTDPRTIISLLMSSYERYIQQLHFRLNKKMIR